MKLLQKILIIITSLTLVTSLTIGIFSYYRASKSTNELMMSKVENQLHLRKKIIEEKIRNTKSTISLVAHDQRVLNGLTDLNLETVSEALTTVKKENSKLISLIALADASNIVVATDVDNQNVVGVDISARAYLKEAIENKQTVISDLIVSKASDKHVIAICTPIYKNEEYLGSVIATIDFVLISEVVLETRIATEGYAYMIDITGDNAGTIVSHPVQSYVEEGTSLYDFKDEKIDQIAEEMINQSKGSSHYVFDGDAKYVEYERVENWALAITANENDLNATSISIRNAMIITIIISLFCSIIISYFLVKSIITNPISELETAMDQAGHGDLNVHIHNPSKDEIGNLSKSFIKMTDALKDVIKTINVASEQVTTGSQQLSDSSMSLSQGAAEQAASIEELTASMKEISSQTEKNAHNAKKAESIVEEAMNYADVGNNQMHQMLTAMEHIDESSNNISKIIQVIDDIAFQTNILALNAAVEAARAGEHGKGFAVVAEEVRNLAAQSAEAAKETTHLIEGSMAKVKDGTSIAKATAESLEKMVKKINQTTEYVHQITKASSNQAFGVKQVNQGIMQISSVIQTTSATAEETAASSEELSGQANMLQGKVSTFKI